MIIHAEWKILTYLLEGNFPSPCSSCLSPHTSTWWLYLNISPMKKIASSSSVVLFVLCHLRLVQYSSEMSQVVRTRDAWINRMKKRCHLVKQAYSLMASRNLLTWSSDLAQCLNKTRCIILNLHSHKKNSANLTGEVEWYSSNWTKRQLRNLKIKFG